MHKLNSRWEAPFECGRLEANTQPECLLDRNSNCYPFLGEPRLGEIALVLWKETHGFGMLHGNEGGRYLVGRFPFIFNGLIARKDILAYVDSCNRCPPIGSTVTETMMSPVDRDPQILKEGKSHPSNDVPKLLAQSGGNSNPPTLRCWRHRLGDFSDTFSERYHEHSFCVIGDNHAYKQAGCGSLPLLGLCPRRQKTIKRFLRIVWDPPQNGSRVTLNEPYAGRHFAK